MDEEIIEIIDFLGPHKVMVSSIFHQKMEKKTQTDHRLRTYLSAQLGHAIYQDWYFIQGPF